MLQHFNTVLHAVVNPNRIIIILLLVHNCNFVTIMDQNANIWYEGDLICDPQRVQKPQIDTPVLNSSILSHYVSCLKQLQCLVH